MASSTTNLYSKVSELKQHLEAKGSDTKKKSHKKQSRSREDGSGAATSGRKGSPGGKKQHTAKGEKETVKMKLLPTRMQRATEGFAAKSRKYKDPLNKRLKDVIGCLLETRKDMSKGEICGQKGVDPEDQELWKAVLDNQRIEVLKEMGKFRYRPRHHLVVDKEQLLMHIRRNSRGTAWNDIADTYANVEADVKALVDEKKAFVIENPDIDDKVIFWNDPTVESLKMSDDMLELWKEAQAPSDNRTYEELLKKAGITPAVRKAAGKREPLHRQTKERKPKAFKHRKVTNVHIPELFTSDPPEQID